MKCYLVSCVAASLVGCGTTLPSEESVLLVVAEAEVLPGSDVAAMLVNESSERLAVGDLPCSTRLIDQVSREPAAPPLECDGYAMFFEPGRIIRFRFTAPTEPGSYRLEVPLSASDPESESGLLSVRSQVFTVSGPTPRE